MNFRRGLGILLLAIGIGMIGVASYIKIEVQAGQNQINSAQKKVDQSTGLFSLTPVTKEVGKNITGSAQKQINAGQDEVDHYTRLSSQLQYGGIALMVIGVCFIFFGKKKSRR